MKALQRNYLLRSNILIVFTKTQRQWLLPLCLLCCLSFNAQVVGNYVSNGSFEEYDECLPLYAQQAKYWTSPDSLCFGYGYVSTCNNFVPHYFEGYQYPRTGEAYIDNLFYCLTSNPVKRTYTKNRMKSALQAGRTYCVKFYVNIYNPSTCGIDGIGAYFGGSEIDTITKCNVPLTYIIPQVQNLQGNIITDTLNWVAITGTFTANGTEKYLLLGNFLSDEDTDTLIISPNSLPTMFTDIEIDDVSCIPIDLEAYAGRDTTIYLGDSAYIGREPDFAIDTGCVWYQLPNTTPIDTISGMWVKPNATGSYTYVVRQELECSSLKWDTVVVTVREFDVGLQEYEKEKWTIELYPNPAQDKITLRSNHESEELNITITDVTGRIIYVTSVKTKLFVADMELNLINGAYFITIKSDHHESITKKLLIAK